MGCGAQRSAGARATPTGGLEQGSQGAGLYRRPTVVLVRSPVVCWPPSARSVPSAGRPGGTGGACRPPADRAGPAGACRPPADGAGP
jgi:hypothetical protein